MDEFDFDFLSLTMGMVGLFFICCAIMQRKPKHILEELFGVYTGGLRHLKDSVFKKNQLVLGFLCILIALIVNIFSRSMAVPEGADRMARSAINRRLRSQITMAQPARRREKVGKL